MVTNSPALRCEVTDNEARCRGPQYANSAVKIARKGKRESVRVVTEDSKRERIRPSPTKQCKKYKKTVKKPKHTDRSQLEGGEGTMREIGGESSG